jgi:acetyltransferase-like isoleucine patch superfamily enzyme
MEKVRMSEIWRHLNSCMQRWTDLISEITGAYRLSALSKRGVIALSAQVKSPSRLFLGRDVSIQRGAILHCGGKKWSGYAGYVRLQDGVRIGPYCVIYGAGGVEFGEHVHLGPGVKVMSQAGKHDVNRLTSSPTYSLGPVKIGTGSWVGAGAVILEGSEIGRCVSVAPNAVISGVIPDFAVVAGNPARVVFKNDAIST